MTCATWEHVRRSASSLAGLTDVSGPSPRAAESLASGGRSAQGERGSDSGVADAALMRIEPMRDRLSRTSPSNPSPGTSRHRLPRDGASDSHRSVPLASIKECQLRFRNIRDYTCTFSKRERIKGQLTPLQRDHDEGADPTQEHLPQVPSAFARARSHLYRRAQRRQGLGP